MEQDVKVLYARASSHPRQLSKAVIRSVVNRQNVELHALGEAAIARAVKAIAIAQEFFELNKQDIICTPVYIKTGEFSGISFKLSKIKKESLVVGATNDSVEK